MLTIDGVIAYNKSFLDLILSLLSCQKEFAKRCKIGETGKTGVFSLTKQNKVHYFAKPLDWETGARVRPSPAPPN